MYHEANIVAAAPKPIPFARGVLLGALFSWMLWTLILLIGICLL